MTILNEPPAVTSSETLTPKEVRRSHFGRTVVKWVTSTDHKVIVRSTPGVHARRAIVRKATVRLPRAVRALTATVPVRSRRSRSASRKTAFPLTINR